MNCSDFGKNDEGLNFDDFLIAAKELSGQGIDAIELSGGTMDGVHSACRLKNHEAYHLEYAKKLTEEVDTSVILVGGLRNFEKIEEILSKTDIEAVAISRALIREPGLVKRWMDGDLKKADCVACCGCLNPNGTRCFFELEGEEREAQKEVMKAMGLAS